MYRPHLTERELQVLACLTAGLSYREIAEHLCVSVGTARTHVYHIIDALQCVNSRGAACYGLVSGRVAQAELIELLRRYRPHFFV